MYRAAYIACILLMMLCNAEIAAGFSLWGTGSGDKVEKTENAVHKDLTSSKVALVNGSNKTRAQVDNTREASLDDTIIKLLSKIDNLQQEVQELRGLLELQGHELSKLERKQIDLYSDLDNRVATLLGNNYQLSSNASNNTSYNLAKEQGVAGDEKKNIGIVNDALSNDELIVSTDPNIAQEQEKALYKKAYDLLQENKYTESEDLLQKMIVKFPSGNYTPNAYYWLGELYLNEGKVQEAQLSFSQIVEEFPRHEKAAESLLKLGTIEYSMGNIKQAARIFKEVTIRYPGTPAARLAILQMRKI